MITDGFMFFNELELLEIRLNELSSVVDRFILVETRETFSFRPKPLFYYENRARFKRFWDRIDHHVIDRFPVRDSPWAAERTQRDQIGRAFGDGDPEDLLICSDLDEIPRAAAITDDVASAGPMVLLQPQYYMFLNCLTVNLPLLNKALVVRRKHLTRPISDYRLLTLPGIPNGGWHFSFLGGAQRVRAKMSAYSHQEFNLEFYTSDKNYQRALRAGRLHFDAGLRIREVPLDASFPRYVLEHRADFAHLIAPPGLIASSRSDLAQLLVGHALVSLRERLRRRWRQAWATRSWG